MPPPSLITHQAYFLYPPFNCASRKGPALSSRGGQVLKGLCHAPDHLAPVLPRYSQTVEAR